MTPGKLWFEAWNAHDVDGIAPLVAEDVQFRDPHSPHPMNLDEALGLAKVLFAAFPDIYINIESELSGPDFSVFEYTWGGTQTGPFQALPPSGRKIHLPGIDVFRYRGDKITSVNAYYDRAKLLEQLGLIPKL